MINIFDPMNGMSDEFWEVNQGALPDKAQHTRHYSTNPDIEGVVNNTANKVAASAFNSKTNDHIGGFYLVCAIALTKAVLWYLYSIARDEGVNVSSV